MRVLFLIFLTAIKAYGLIRYSKEENIFCQQITAFYNGTFQSPYNTSKSFDVKLRINIEINLADKRLYFQVNNFSRKFSESYEFGLYDDATDVYCDTDQKESSIKFDSLSYFRVDFWPPVGLYNPDLLNITPLLNKRFTLLNAIGNCGTALKNNDLNDSNPALYKSCFCCGDKYNPNSSLGCPVSPWN